MSAWMRRFERFAELSDDDVALLERIFVVSTYPAGHVFVREGERGSATTAAMYLIVEGNVRVEAQAPEGGFGVRRTLGPGQFVGLLSLLADTPRSATCTAEGKVTAARLDRATLQELFRHDVGVHARFQLVIAKHLARDLRELGTLVEEAIRSGDDRAVRERFGS